MWDFCKAQREAHETARAKGFYDDDEIVMREILLTDEERMALRRRLILARLAMVASEVGEAVDAVRKSDVNTTAFLETVKVTDWIPPSADPNFTAVHTRDLRGTTHGSELADIVIRTMDLAEYMGIDLSNEIQAKMVRNSRREHRHGKLA
jgi:NTP pyrophosphatase (non-canonical NTP hydrolase)